MTHYAATGYFEGRALAAFKVGEPWYRKKYPDVARAERRGQATAADCYAWTGRKEGRAASAADEKFQAILKSALGG